MEPNMNLIVNAQAARRVLCLIAFFLLAAYVSVPANAVTCALGFDAPTGGGPSANPIQATGRIVCSSTVTAGGAVVNAYLVKDNTTITQASQSVTGHSSRTLPLSAPCSPGNWSITVTATVPGATLNQPVVNSQSIPFTCGGGTIPGNPTLTSGHQWWEVGSGTEYQVTHFFGFLRAWNMGAMSPTTTPDGKIYEHLYDMNECSIFGCHRLSTFSITGFSSNPGAGWLNSITALGVTRLGSEAGYSFSGTTATWTWDGEFGLGTATTIPITLSHN
jgi:hypothetical protein